MKLDCDCPCKGCTTRHLACHDSCSGYAEFKNKRETVKQRRLEENRDLSAYIKRVATRAEKSK